MNAASWAVVPAGRRWFGCARLWSGRRIAVSGPTAVRVLVRLEMRVLLATGVL